MPDFDVADLELAERDATADITRAATRVLPTDHPAAVEVLGTILCTAVVGAPPMIFNRAFGVGIEEPADGATLDAIEQVYARLGVPFRIPVAPAARPTDLGERLVARGYRRGPAWMKFARAPEAPAPAETDLEIRRIGADHGEAFGRVVVECFGLPPWTAPVPALLPGRPGWSCYAAFAGESLVATGAVWVGGGRAWFGFGTALPAVRGRGSQRALLAARIRAAVDQGARVLTVETGVAEEGRPGYSYRNILAAGFVEAYRRENFDSPSSAA